MNGGINQTRYDVVKSLSEAFSVIEDSQNDTAHPHGSTALPGVFVKCRYDAGVVPPDGQQTPGVAAQDQQLTANSTHTRRGRFSRWKTAGNGED